MHWLSRNWFVARHEREAVGHDGEKYEWIRIYVGEIRNSGSSRRLAYSKSTKREEQAFAYADERMRASSRLAVTNRASEVRSDLGRAFQLSRHRRSRRDLLRPDHV